MSHERLLAVLNIAGAVASLVGLVLSGIAAFQAKRAREAATTAVSTLRRRDAAEEIGSLVTLAAQLSHFVQSRDSKAAGVRAIDLSQGIQTLTSRRYHFVAEDAASLKLTADQLVRVSRSLATNGIPDDASAFGKLFGRCQDAHTLLSGLVGKVQREVEEEDDESN
jgi:hypothetical protein